MPPLNFPPLVNRPLTRLPLGVSSVLITGTGTSALPKTGGTQYPSQVGVIGLGNGFGGGFGGPPDVPASYLNKLIATFGSSIVALWPQNEPSGSVSNDIGGRGHNGAYTGVTLGQPGIGDGNTAAGYDGATSFNNIYSVGLNSDFNPAEGSAMIWAKVASAGVWTDGIQRRLFQLQADGNNLVRIVKSASANIISVIYSAGGSNKFVDTSSFSLTTWINFLVTWSVTNNRMKWYINGIQNGSNQTSIGTWVGALAPTLTMIGAGSTAPGNVWPGFAGPALILNKEATPSEVAAVANPF